MIYTRRTIAHDVAFSGRGLHSGIDVSMTIRPGQDGIHFRLGSDRVRAIPANVTDTTRSTRVGPIGTVEHLMSALAALRITDAEVEFTAPEVPGLDGSAQPFFDSIHQAGFVALESVERPDLYRRLFKQEEETKVAVSKGEGHWRYEYDVSPRWPGVMAYESPRVMDAYAAQIAPARTFALSEEVPHLITLGLGQGLDENSALIIGEEGFKNAARFPDEPARHKLLDLVGDLYLAGVPIEFLNVSACRSGHRFNVTMADMLFRAVWGDPPA